MLRLTLDTSAATGREVEDRLDEVAKQPVAAADADLVQALLAHARLLRNLLPTTDGVLKALCAVPETQNRETVRAILVAQQGAARASARQSRFLLYATSLLLLALLVHVGLRLRARAQALRRRAAFEHVIAGISMRFINAQPQQIGGRVEQALAELAKGVGADRAYFVLRGRPARVHAWSRDGIASPPGWLDQAFRLAARFERTAEGIVYIPSVDRLPPGADREALVAAGLNGWLCVPSVGVDGVSAILGFDALAPTLTTRSGELGLMRMALDAIANAVRRDSLERERGRLEARLQQAGRMETVGALASGIAHNFNNIVGAILGHAEIVEAQLAPDSRPARNLDAIRRAGQRARDLIDQILAFGRRRDGRRGPVHVQALIAEAASLLQASLPAQIELVIRAGDEKVFVSGEPAQLQQVILNLGNNAAQAMDNAGRVEIVAEVREITRATSLTHGELVEGRYVRIAVSDGGRGMNDATMRRIFEPFFTTRAAGNGLGLATVREIVREHGGAMDVRSSPGAGSCFETWLPCLGTSTPSEEASALPFGHGETLLVVDDDHVRLLTDEEILAALGYEPVGFARAGAALAACRAAPARFDAVLVVDLMRAASAVELAAQLREIAPDLPILLATASTEEISADALVAAGISEVVRRPLVSFEVAAALKRCLQDGPAKIQASRARSYEPTGV
jgi:signal transduction histidine kinase/CheY-like chemotaxis protein